MAKKRKVKEDSYETQLFFANISKKTTEHQLFQIFSQFGSITACSIVKNQQTGISKQYGFVTFQSALDAGDALQALQGQEINGLKIAIELADIDKKGVSRKKASNYMKQIYLLQKMNFIKRRSPSPLKAKSQNEQELELESKIQEKRKYWEDLQLQKQIKLQELQKQKEQLFQTVKFRYNKSLKKKRNLVQEQQFREFIDKNIFYNRQHKGFDEKVQEC